MLRNPMAEGDICPRLCTGVLLRRPRLELEADPRLVSYYRRVVTGLDDVSIASFKVLLGPIVVDNMQRARLNDAHMPDLAAIGADDGLDALRPLPAGLKRQAADGRAPNPDELRAGLLRSTRLIRRTEIQLLNASHAPLP